MLPSQIEIDKIKGFLAPEEGQALYRYALDACVHGPALEVGSYCGKSTIYLGTACRQVDAVVYAVDHHRGSEEHQPGEEYHDTDLFDANAGLMDSFREFRRTMRTFDLEQAVVPLVAPSDVAAKQWQTPLALVFIDGGHSEESAQADLKNWSGKIMQGGLLAIHDLFPDPNEGGQAPINIWRAALASGDFEEVETVKTLGLLRRK